MVLERQPVSLPIKLILLLQTAFGLLLVAMGIFVVVDAA